MQICVVSALVGVATASAGLVPSPERALGIGRQTGTPGAPGVEGSVARSVDVGGVATPRRYVALGDSYSSGEGNPPFTNALCHRGDAAWPNFVTGPTVALIENVACSGAAIGQLTRSWPRKGEGAQIPAAASLHPDVVSVTIGGNDLGFAGVLADCFLSPGCDADGTLARVRTMLPGLRSRLTSAYRTLRAGTSAHVVVVGYPRIFPTVKPRNCAWLSERERRALNALAAEIDVTLSQAATDARVDYVSVLGVLAGHELCTPSSWVYPLRIQCALPGRSDCGHPTRLGLRAIARMTRPVISRS